MVFGDHGIARSCLLNRVVREIVAVSVLQQTVMILLASTINDRYNYLQWDRNEYRNGASEAPLLVTI